MAVALAGTDHRRRDIDDHIPITSGNAEIHSNHVAKPGWNLGSIQHHGSSLTLSAGGTKVTLSNFVVDPSGSVLYGTVGDQTSAGRRYLQLDAGTRRTLRRRRRCRRFERDPRGERAFLSGVAAAVATWDRRSRPRHR